MMDFNQRANLVPCYLLLLLICSVDKLEEFHKDTGCLPFHRKFLKFRMEGNNIIGKVTFRKFQPKIEEYFLRKSVRSGWYKPNGNVADHLPTSWFFLGSRLTLHKFAPFLDISNCYGCGNSVVNW